MARNGKVWWTAEKDSLSGLGGTPQGALTPMMREAYAQEHADEESIEGVVLRRYAGGVKTHEFTITKASAE